VNNEIQALAKSIAKSDMKFIFLESLILYFAIEVIGNLTGIVFVGKGSVIVTISYFLGLLYFFSAPIYKSPFFLISGYEHYARVIFDLSKLYTFLAFEFFLFNLLAGRAFFLFAVPVAIALRLLGRKSLKVIYSKAIREIPVSIFTQRKYVKDYLSVYFSDIRVYEKVQLEELGQKYSSFSNSLILIHSGRDLTPLNESLLYYLSELGLNIGFLDSFSQTRRRVGTRIIFGALMVVLISPPSVTFKMRFLKRLLDLVISSAVLFSLILISPIFYVFYRWKNGKPLIYKQFRVGKDGGKFTMFKIRTMLNDINHQEHEVLAESEWVPKPDRRNLVAWGGFLRRWSIDELPQFINVFIGDMSLVGPRPRLEHEKGQFAYSLRLTVRPGITGLWQISGRNSITPSDAEELDNFYIENWNLLMDVQICLKTFSAIRRGFGAV
jgi:lipopolysaccharide/colanic/teichoic acid biosynthesis glycosyltransferase